MTDQASGHGQFEELAAGYALDALEPADEQNFLRHALSCPVCTQTLADYREVAAAIASTAPSAEPSPQLADRILAAARADLSTGRAPADAAPRTDTGPAPRHARVTPQDAEIIREDIRPARGDAGTRPADSGTTPPGISPWGDTRATPGDSGATPPDATPWGDADMAPRDTAPWADTDPWADTGPRADASPWADASTTPPDAGSRGEGTDAAPHGVSPWADASPWADTHATPPDAQTAGEGRAAGEGGDSPPADRLPPGVVPLRPRGTSRAKPSTRRWLRPINVAAAAVLIAAGGIWGGLAATGGTSAPPSVSSCQQSSGCYQTVLTAATTHHAVAKVLVDHGKVWMVPGAMKADDTADQIYVLWQLTGVRPPLAIGGFDVTSSGSGAPIEIGTLVAPYTGTMAFAVTLEHGRTIPAHPSAAIALGQVS